MRAETPPRIVAVGVDTLMLSWQAETPAGVFSRCEELRKIAEEMHRTHDPAPLCVDLGERTFIVSGRYPRPPFRWMWHSDCGRFILKLSPSERPKGTPAVMVESSALGLWSMGWGNWVDEARDLAQAAVTDPENGDAPAIREERVARLDLAVDMQGGEPWTGSDLEVRRLLCRAGSHRNGEQTQDGKKRPALPLFVSHGAPNTPGFTGYEFGGGGPVKGRIYDKVKEIRKSQKYWMQEVWKRRGWDPDGPNVWRVEVQLRRAACKALGLDTFEPGRLDRAWRWFAGYPAQLGWRACGGWLSLRDPRGDRNRSRWPVSDLWRAYQGAEFCDALAIPGIRDRWDADEEKRALAQIQGYAAALCAIRGIRPDCGAFVCEACKEAHGPPHCPECPGCGKVQLRAALEVVEGNLTAAVFGERLAIARKRRGAAALRWAVRPITDAALKAALEGPDASA